MACGEGGEGVAALLGFRIFREVGVKIILRRSRMEGWRDMFVEQQVPFPYPLHT